MTLFYKPFQPSFGIRAPMMQTALASQQAHWSLNGRGSIRRLRENSRALIVDCADQIRLTGAYTPYQGSRDLVILIHGWEGSQESSYLLGCAAQLYDAGLNIFRLNLRDHGNSHALNEGIFLATRLTEVLNMVEYAMTQLMAPSGRVYLIGFSLGGNFALRIARTLIDMPTMKMAHIFAISPAIDPLGAARNIDKNPLIRRYFLKKFRTNLHKKQAVCPHLYDFTPYLKAQTVWDLSERIIVNFSEYESLPDYFNDYKIARTDLQACPVPLSLISALDDPVVPVAPLQALQLDRQLARIITWQQGGHNGFIDNLFGFPWYVGYILNVITTTG